MMPFKPRKVSFQFFFILGASACLSFLWLSSFKDSRNVFVAIYRYVDRNFSIKKRDAKTENPLRSEKKIGKIKFMNIDYSRLGHRSRGLAAA